jgi:hypothetical protein
MLLHHSCRTWSNFAKASDTNTRCVFGGEQTYERQTQVKYLSVIIDHEIEGTKDFRNRKLDNPLESHPHTRPQELLLQLPGNRVKRER